MASSHNIDDIVRSYHITTWSCWWQDRWKMWEASKVNKSQVCLLKLPLKFMSALFNRVIKETRDCLIEHYLLVFNQIFKEWCDWHLSKMYFCSITFCELFFSSLGKFYRWMNQGLILDQEHRF